HIVPPSSRYLLRKRPRRRTHASFDGVYAVSGERFRGLHFFTPGPKVHASSSDIAARDEVFQCAANIVSIAAGTAGPVLTAIRTSRRVALSSVSRPEWSIPRPSRSAIPAPKRPSIGRVTRPGAAAERSGRMQIRMAIGNHALYPVLSFRAEARRPRR